MEVMTVLVAFELGLTLILEVMKLRLTDSVTCPRSYIFPVTTPGLKPAFLAPRPVCPQRPPPTAALAPCLAGVKPFGL